MAMEHKGHSANERCAWSGLLQPMYASGTQIDSACGSGLLPGREQFSGLVEFICSKYFRNVHSTSAACPGQVLQDF